MLLYGAEVWGLSGDLNIIEKVHVFVMKRFLCVTGNALMLLFMGNVAAIPFTSWHQQGYWLRLTPLPQERLPKKIYAMRYNLLVHNKITWVNHVMMCSYQHGFGFVWESPESVGNTKLFLRVFKERLIDGFRQDWHSKINSSNYLTLYSTFKVDLVRGSFLCELKHVGSRETPFKFRLGVTNLRCHKNRYSTGGDLNWKCPFCDEYETELHFFYLCVQNMRTCDVCIYQGNFMCIHRNSDVPC